MKTIKLIYWRTYIDNYGDLLSPFIIQAYSRKEVIHKNYFVGNFNSHLFQTMKSLIHFDWRFHSSYLLPFEKNVLGIGSILAHGNRKSLIWGSGFMREGEQCTGGTVYALRGKYSLAKIMQQIKGGDPIKLHEKVVLGDPALLLPRLIKPSRHKSFKVAIIPHFSEIEYFKCNFGGRFPIIDFRSSDIEQITREITSCENILSTSLHGIVVAHAYGIPALWIEHTGLEEGTDGFKFYDYFSSVGIEAYSPISDLANVLRTEETALELFDTYSTYKLPVADVSKIGDDLISVTPF